MRTCKYQGRSYTPAFDVNRGISGDSEELCEKYDRLMFVHSLTESKLFIAERGRFYTGWVIGVFDGSSDYQVKGEK